MRKLKMWWRFEGQFYWKDFKQGIKNLWYWFPIIWKNREYDYTYIYTILAHKLKKQAKYTKERSLHTEADKDARYMMICVRLMEKLKEGYYSSEYMDYHTSSFNFLPAKNNDGALMEGYSELEIKELTENFDEYFKKYPLIYGKVRNGEILFSGSDKKTIAMNISHINERRAHNLLYKILNQNIERWWS